MCFTRPHVPDPMFSAKRRRLLHQYTYRPLFLEHQGQATRSPGSKGRSFPYLIPTLTAHSSLPLPPDADIEVADDPDGDEHAQDGAGDSKRLTVTRGPRVCVGDLRTAG